MPTHTVEQLPAAMVPCSQFSRPKPKVEWEGEVNNRGIAHLSRALARAAMSLAEQQAALFAKLKDLGIDTKTVEHKQCFTAEDVERFSRPALNTGPHLRRL
jgi:hypothetical protein